MVVCDSTEAALEDFKEQAACVLRQTLGDFRDALVPYAWGDPHPQPVSQNKYAYEAALLLRAQRRSWLRIQEAQGERRYLHISALGAVLELLDASPYLGVDFMATVLPDPFEPAPGGSRE